MLWQLVNRYQLQTSVPYIFTCWHGVNIPEHLNC